MSSSQQAILEELGYWKYTGAGVSLMTEEQQRIVDGISGDWEDVKRYNEEVVMRGVKDLQTQFLSGKIGPSVYQDKLRELYDDKARYLDSKVMDNPLMLLENRADYYKKYGITQPVQHPFDELVSLFFSIELTQTINPETGALEDDWDKYYAEREAIEAAIPEDRREEWNSYLSKNQTPLEEKRRLLYSQYFNKYYEVWDLILSRYSEDEQRLIKEYLSLAELNTNLSRQQEIKLMAGKDGRQLISGFQSDISDARKALRYANPALDAWLYFWGKTSSFLTPQAEQMFYQISKEMGRKVIL
jgi:hypothetical protein